MGKLTAPHPLAVVDRFWSKVERGGPDECWPWRGAVNYRGSGFFTVRPWGLRNCSAHRLAWRLSQGDPGDLWVLHSCDNPSCCNPRHLFLGTHADNMRDMVAKGRASRRGRRRRLTDEQARETLALHEAGFRWSTLAAMFGFKDAKTASTAVRNQALKAALTHA